MLETGQKFTLATKWNSTRWKEKIITLRTFNK